MLTNKNWALKAFSTGRWVLAVCVAILFAGCQPPGPKSLLLGQKYLEQGNYEKALKYLTRASELMKGHPQVWNHLGLAYHAVNKPKEASDAYHLAIRIDRNLPAPHYNLGVLLLEEGYYPQAVAELQIFLRLQTNSAAGWTKLGTALVRMKKPDEAESALVNALRLDPKSVEAYNNLGLAHTQRKRPREAMIAFNNALEYQEGYPPALLNQAIVAHQHFGDKQLAVDRYKAYLSTKPDAKTAAQVQQAVSVLEREIAGVEIAEAEKAEVETNVFTAALRSNGSSKPSTNHVAAAAATNLVAKAAQPKTNAAIATNVAVAGTQRATHAAPLRNVTNAVAAAGTNAPAAVAKAEPPAAPRTNVTVVAVAPEAKEPGTANSSKETLVSSESAGRTEQASEPEAKVEPKAEIEPEPLEVEVVQVNIPEFKPATDVVGVKPIATEVAAAPAPASEQRALIIPRKERKPEEKQPGFFSKVNPVRWFKDDEKEAAKPTQVAIARAEAKEAMPPPRPSYPPVVKTTNPRPEAPRVIPRYQYRKNISLNAGDRTVAEKVFAQGAEAHQRRRLADAMEAYQNATAIDPTYYEAHYNLGLAAYQNKNLPMALAANELALAVKPASTDARYNFALALRDANYPADAVAELRTLIASNPEETRAHFSLANIYAQHLDQPVLARKHYLAVLELEPSHPEAPLIRQWLSVNQAAGD